MTRKEIFIDALADFLVGNQAGKSIMLQLEMEKAKKGNKSSIEWAKEWAALRNTTPLFGYPTKEEAIKELNKFFSWFGE